MQAVNPVKCFLCGSKKNQVCLSGIYSLAVTEGKSYFWYPFRSIAVKSICENLTPEEEAIFRACGQSREFMTSESLVVVILLANYHFRYLSILAILYYLYSFVWRPRHFFGWGMNEEQKEMLCSTEYAKLNGIFHDNLRIHAFDLGLINRSRSRKTR
jgi:hypothetical protein